jgi:hypothetical protein
MDKNVETWKYFWMMNFIDIFVSVYMFYSFSHKNDFSVARKHLSFDFHLQHEWVKIDTARADDFVIALYATVSGDAELSGLKRERSWLAYWLSINIDIFVYWISINIDTFVHWQTETKLLSIFSISKQLAYLLCFVSHPLSFTLFVRPRLVVCIVRRMNRHFGSPLANIHRYLLRLTEF